MPGTPFMSRLRRAFHTPEGRLTLGLCALIVLLMGTYGTVLIVDKQNDLREDAERRGLELARGLSLIGATAVLDNLFVVQEALTRQAGRDPDILSVMVVDRDRRVIASDNPRQIGETLTAAAHQAEVGGGEFILEEKDSQARARLVVFEPLRSDGTLLGWVRVELSLERTWREAYRILWKQLLATIGLLVVALYVFLRMVRRLKDALHASEEKYRLLWETSTDAVIFMDTDRRVRFANPALKNVFGYDPGEVIGRDVAMLQPERLRALHREGMERYLRSGVRTLDWRATELVGLRKDGAEVPIEIAFSDMETEGRRWFIGFMRDITKRKRAEERLGVQYAIARALAESATLDEVAPRILQAICGTLGWDQGMLWSVDRQTNVLRCVEVWHAPSVKVEEFEALARETTFSPGVGLPGRVWASGEPVWIADVVRDENFPRAPVAVREGLHAAFAFPILFGKTVLGVIEFFSRQIRQPDEHLLQMFAAAGSQIGQFLERKRTEATLRESEDQLRQSQKMEAIGKLAGGIAHDFNNLLTAISGYSELLVGQVRSDLQARKNAEEIRKAAFRAASLTHQLLAFGRRQMLTTKVLNLNAVIIDLEPMLRRLIGEDIELAIVPGPALGQVQADPSQIEQIILNLVVNARDAMPKGGKLTIGTANVELSEEYTGRHVPFKPGSYVLVAVSDTGCGMDAETRSRIFEPFFTTKEPGKGTGLGLSTVYGIVKQSDGYVWVYSEPGRGATFKIYLPRVRGALDKAPGDMDRARIPPGTETILLVEDEETVRGLVSNVLAGGGYRVLVASHSEEAFQVSGQYEGTIHLMVADVVMPRMSGRELAERLASSRPKMKVLYISGYTDDAVVRHGVLTEGTAFLQKPFTPEVLLRKVRDVLEASVRGSVP